MELLPPERLANSINLFERIPSKFDSTKIHALGRWMECSHSKSILDADPEALTRKDVFPIRGENHRVTPLGVACRTNARPIVIRFLIDVRVTLERQVRTKAA